MSCHGVVIAEASLYCANNLFHNLLPQAIHLDDNQNRTEQPLPQAPVSDEVNTPASAPATTTVLPDPEVKKIAPSRLEPEIQNPKPETASMEVHKHPHHVMHKKNWPEYVLEFFMLFLAVFLGFVAENIREHSVNKEIEKRNIESLISNIKEDSIALTQSIEVNRDRLVFLDSLLVLKTSNLPERAFREQFIYYMLKLGYLNYFSSNGSTFEQMRSSGTLRLLSHEVLDSILKYQTLYATIRQQGEICISWWNKSIEKISETIDLVPLTKLGRNPILNVTRQSIQGIELPEFPKDPDALRYYYNWRMNERIAQAYYNEKLYDELQYLKRLLPFLKKKYNLD
jgi:hypothetical protein